MGPRLVTDESLPQQEFLLLILVGGIERVSESGSQARRHGQDDRDRDRSRGHEEMHTKAHCCYISQIDAGRVVDVAGDWAGQAGLSLTVSHSRRRQH